jgi:septal ring factor EnvC (AmiA/AmiB activator)
VLQELKKKPAGDVPAAAATNVTAGEQAELEELRSAKARLEKKLREAKKDYDELEKEVLALEEENAQLEEELKKVNGSKK